MYPTLVSTLGNSPVSASQVLRSQVGSQLSSQSYSRLSRHDFKMCIDSSADPVPPQRLLSAFLWLCVPCLTPRQAEVVLCCMIFSSENFLTRARSSILSGNHFRVYNSTVILFFSLAATRTQRNKGIIKVFISEDP